MEKQFDGVFMIQKLKNKKIIIKLKSVPVSLAAHII